MESKNDPLRSLTAAVRGKANTPEVRGSVRKWRMG
jgi:hypothetical protein